MIISIKRALILIILSINILFSLTELVGDLPGYPYKGKMFSGYLNLNNPKKKLHYLFLESQNDPSTDPVLLWLNGGPGCSSLLGWAQEHGPAVFKEMSKEWEINDYSWNKKANVIYLESPAGVGFSYIDSKDDSDWIVNDETSSVQNLEAMVQFFLKFPDFKRNDFYISGESYAGIYVPFLATRINEYNLSAIEVNKINLKGILVGNGVTDWKVDTSPAMIEFGFTHGLYSVELRQKYITSCQLSNQNEVCEGLENQMLDAFNSINIYDIYRTCYITENPETVNQKSYNNKKFLEFLEEPKKSQNKYPYTPWVFSRAGKKIGENNSIYLGEEKENETEKNLKGTPPCTDSVGPDAFFNRDDVKAALFVKPDLQWSMCNSRFEDSYKRDMEKGSFFLYKDLIASKIKILIYSGDTDGAVPFTGTRKWIKNLNLDIKEKWRSWRVNDKELAGYVEKYQGLTFVTVKGTGHMVPQWKKVEAFYMLNQFLNGKDL